MKRRNLLFAAIFAMFSCAGFSVKAQDSVFSYLYQGTTLYYIIDSNQQARVVPPLYPNLHWNADSTVSQSWYGYGKPQGAVVVPDSVMFNGGYYPVTGLLKYAFYRCDSVTSVTLPASVTYLGNDAFTRCSLETVSMPGVTFMGEGCFYYAESLTSVDIPSGVAFIPEWGFDHCSSLQSVTLHNGTTAIGKSAFRCCHNLSSITLPESLTSIGLEAFYECTALQSVSLPDGLTDIEIGLFALCSSLQSITLPANLTTIGLDAFYGCTSLQSVDIPGSVSIIDEWCFGECCSLTHVTLHEGTETIGYATFNGCTSLTTINFPSTLKEIGDFAFQFDSSLSVPLILPEGLIYAGLVAFGDCSSILTANLPGSLGEVPAEIFYGCTSLTTVVIGNGIMNVGEQAFNHCPNIDTFYVKCAVPPTVESPIDSTFFVFNSTVVVPCDAEEAYRQHAAWGLFSDIVEDCGVGISEVDLPEVTIRVANNHIEVEGAEGETVRVFDISGRLIRNEALSAGLYLVQVGNRPVQKVLVHPNM